MNRCNPTKKIRAAVLQLLLAGWLPIALFSQGNAETWPYRYAVWGGGAYNLVVGDDSQSDIGFLFGAEFRLKEKNICLSVQAASQSPGPHYYKRKGVSGEFGPAIKFFSQGKLTGRISHAYWGFDFRFGRSAYIDLLNETAKRRWFKVMLRFGYQYTSGKFFFELGLPFGLQFVHISSPGSFYGDYQDNSFVVQPLIMAGYCF